MLELYIYMYYMSNIKLIYTHLTLNKWEWTSEIKYAKIIMS